MVSCFIWAQLMCWQSTGFNKTYMLSLPTFLFSHYCSLVRTYSHVETVFQVQIFPSWNSTDYCWWIRGTLQLALRIFVWISLATLLYRGGVCLSQLKHLPIPHPTYLGWSALCQSWQHWSCPRNNSSCINGYMILLPLLILFINSNVLDEIYKSNSPQLIKNML